MLAVLFVGVLLTNHWEPTGADQGFLRNFIFVALLIGVLLSVFKVFQHFYPVILRWLNPSFRCKMGQQNLLILWEQEQTLVFGNAYGIIGGQ